MDWDGKWKGKRVCKWDPECRATSVELEAPGNEILPEQEREELQGFTAVLHEQLDPIVADESGLYWSDSREKKLFKLVR